MSFAWSLLLGLGLGLSLAAPPGPMNALIARESSRHGAAAGIRAGVAAPVADTIYLALLGLGIGRLLSEPAWVRGAALGGAFLMAYFSYGTWNTPARPPPESAAAQPATFWAALGMALANPYQIAWWLSGGFVFLQREGWWGIAGLLCGIFGWVVVFSWLVAHGATRWTWFAPAVKVVSALMLAFFAVLLLLVALALIGV
ncbi:MAG: LysE family transporter [Thermoplasmatota archaeon]